MECAARSSCGILVRDTRNVRSRMGVREKAKPEVTLGRPRSQRARKAIIQSAIELIRVKPFNTLTVVEVAAKAGVSTATIYRWWRTKEDLLIEAVVERYADTLRFPASKSPLESIRRQLINGARFLTTAEGQLYLNFVTKGELDPSQRETYYQRFHLPLYTEFLRLIKQAIKTGELPERTPVPLAYDLLNGPLFLRALLGDTGTISSTYINRMFNVAVAGLWERFG